MTIRLKYKYLTILVAMVLLDALLNLRLNNQ